ncbi:hypothetical protein [Flagellimonas halotolerans]|uniref:Uncharacterized protein n=1 Tax=Flagellimonas halotolerans TaxID=3112164 RepID=A0ABU6IT76_9FLAO|nr:MULTISPECIES: hypothetical protein [unclassified Allomuricauda]MEC3966307.1 hypothetical protein [Muricauda sp. SYSU M86414]MEC4266172.1 hypothetical protein [Muricauda sp. SYSU M84420]
MKRLFHSVFLAASLLFFIASCTEEQDFNQIDDLRVTPTLASGLFYFESDEETINSVGALNSFYSQEINFEAFNEQYVAERLLEGTITYEIENTTNKQLEITIEFLDEAGQLLDTEAFPIDPNSIFTNPVFYGAGGKSIDILVNTSSLRITANNLSDDTSVSSAEDPKLILRSGGEFLFQLQ